MHCMLDTGTCIYVFKGAPGIEPKVALEHCCISTVVLGELEYGVANSHPNRREQNEEALLDFISCIHILPVTDVVAKMYGSVRTQPYLKKTTDRAQRYVDRSPFTCRRSDVNNQ